MDILSKIIVKKMESLNQLKRLCSIRDLEKSKFFNRNNKSIVNSLKENETSIIAEHKRKSPSKSEINFQTPSEKIIKGYQKAGAAALSILTEENFFNGSNKDISNYRNITDLPILRKDFIIDEFQIIESKSIGADGILLIAACLDKKQIIELLPHREPMLLIDELYDIKKLFSATAVVNVKKDSFFVNGHFPGQPVMPGVLIVESFGQAAAALTAHGLDKSTYENKLVFLMGVEKARFRNPVIPDCKLILKIEAIRSHGRVWKYKGEAFVDDKKMADAIWSATIVDKK